MKCDAGQNVAGPCAKKWCLHVLTSLLFLLTDSARPFPWWSGLHSETTHGVLMKRPILWVNILISRSWQMVCCSSPTQTYSLCQCLHQMFPWRTSQQHAQELSSFTARLAASRGEAPVLAQHIAGMSLGATDSGNVFLIALIKSCSWWSLLVTKQGKQGRLCIAAAAITWFRSREKHPVPREAEQETFCIL